MERVRGSGFRTSRHFLNPEPCSRSRGPEATTPGLHPGNDGSSPSWIISILDFRFSIFDWQFAERQNRRRHKSKIKNQKCLGAAGPMARHLACNQEIGVRLLGGPLSEISALRSEI